MAPVVRYPEALAREFFATAEQVVRREELQDAPAPSEEAFEYDGRREGFGQHAPAFEEKSFGRDRDAAKFDETRRRYHALKLALEEGRVFRPEVRGKFSLRDEALAYDGRFVARSFVRSEHSQTFAPPLARRRGVILRAPAQADLSMKKYSLSLSRM